MPHISDIGIIGAVVMRVDKTHCTGCGTCAARCKDKAISLDGQAATIDERRCMRCGECLIACSFGATWAAATGFRVLLGGRLGRHPRLGTEVPGLQSGPQVVDIVRRVCREVASAAPGLRLGDIVEMRGAAWAAESALPDGAGAVNPPSGVFGG
jgi:dissimilatory sulfite reductase (desulfoviridin) alpha/beta subunit